MKKFTAVVLDTSGIQKYVFGSNSLKHIIGASGLVYEVTQVWVCEELVKTGLTNLVFNKENQEWQIKPEALIENGELTAELVYAGGGNTVILFNTAEKAEEFIRCLSRRVLQEAPGLDVLFASQEFDWDDPAKPLRKIIQEVVDQVNQRKLNRRFSMPLLGLGVTADCQYTGLPAVRVEDGDRISAEVWAKLQASARSDERLQKIVPEEYRNYYEFAANFNEIGDKHQSSYLAVVHIDGNSMGKRVLRTARQDKNKDNRQYIFSMRDFSDSIEKAAQESLQDTILTLLLSIKDEKLGGAVKIKDTLPFRPIIFGGDDITFVCDGRLGLTLTAHYLQQITQKPLSDGETISARGGVALVKTHYPFARAYQIAEELAASARTYISESDQNEIKQTTAMDWHFSSSGPVQGLEQIRKQEYSVPAGSLVMRPVRLGEDGDWRTWEQFSRFVQALSDPEGDWVERRNKVKELREVLREGPQKVNLFRTLFRLPPLPSVAGEVDASKDGWIGKRCTIFDAIEVMDFFIPLMGVEHE